ncbi:MAG: hypothetical protein H0V56_08755 [Chthoniobacterales bacterium]|nr:hypothetical protein [Chthoniobacterales bacterium]
MQVHVGCSGWFYWHWRGLFYPDNDRDAFAIKNALELIRLLLEMRVDVA